MKHPLNFLLRFGRSDAERLAVLGDKELFWAFVYAHRTPNIAPRMLFADVRYTLRRWRHRPGFATTAILTLGLGIAAATSIFSVVDAVLPAGATGGAGRSGGGIEAVN